MNRNEYRKAVCLMNARKHNLDIFLPSLRVSVAVLQFDGETLVGFPSIASGAENRGHQGQISDEASVGGPRRLGQGGRCKFRLDGLLLLVVRVILLWKSRGSVGEIQIERESFRFEFCA